MGAPAIETQNQTPGRADAPNRTREHLANERTFLAWVRTALALLGLGFVLARMGLFLRQLAAIGGASIRLPAHAGNEFLITGLVFLVLGTALGAGSGWHYDRARKAIDSGQFEAVRLMVIALTAVIAAGGLVIVGLVLWRTLTIEVAP